MNTTDSSKNIKRKKSKYSFFRILTLVIVFCVAVFGAIIISDLVSKNQTDKHKGEEPEFITLKISGDDIYLDSEKIDFEALREYLDTESEKDGLPVVSLINDTRTPSDYTVYNKVVDLLGEYGINVERMIPSTSDEITDLPTQDEV